jgi:hypothetical protein
MTQGRDDLLPPAHTDDLEWEETGDEASKADIAEIEKEEEEIGGATAIPGPFAEGVLGGLALDPCGRGGPRVSLRHGGRRVDLGAAQLLGMLMGHLRKGVERAHGGDNVRFRAEQKGRRKVLGWEDGWSRVGSSRIDRRVDPFAP